MLPSIDPAARMNPLLRSVGNLTVTGDGTQLSAECTAATNPAIEVGGNVTISGDPGTNAYTVKAYNKYDTPRDRVEGLRPSQMPSAIEISGDSLSISNSARVMAKTKSDGAAVWMPALKVISVVDASLLLKIVLTISLPFLSVMKVIWVIFTPRDRLI